MTGSSLFWAHPCLAKVCQSVRWPPHSNHWLASRVYGLLPPRGRRQHAQSAAGHNAGSTIVSTIGIIPRIPTQLIESGSYFLIFILLFFGYWKWHWYKKQGLLFGIFLTLLFSARFIIEFWKEHQTLDGGASLNMGQWLSVPAVSIGLFFIVRALIKKSTENKKTELKWDI